MTHHCFLTSYIQPLDRHNNIYCHKRWFVQQYQTGTNSLVRNNKYILDFVHQSLNINILGLIHNDELDGELKWPSNPNFLHILHVTLVYLFPLNIFLYYVFIILLNYRFFFIRQDTIFKVFHVFKPFIPVDISSSSVSPTQ